MTLEGGYKKTVPKRHMPVEFSKNTIDTITRIESNHAVIGVIYIVGDRPAMCTLPESMSQVLGGALPKLSRAVYNAVAEVDITDEPIAFRIETRSVEIMAATDAEFTACAVQRVHERKRRQHRKRHTYRN